MNWESRKGLDCPYKPITCQEDYCSECQIFIDYHTPFLKDANLKTQILTIKDKALAESNLGSREHKFQMQAMVNAYDVVLNLMKEEK